MRGDLGGRPPSGKGRRSCMGAGGFARDGATHTREGRREGRGHPHMGAPLGCRVVYFRVARRGSTMRGDLGGRPPSGKGRRSCMGAHGFAAKVSQGVEERVAGPRLGSHQQRCSPAMQSAAAWRQPVHAVRRRPRGETFGRSASPAAANSRPRCQCAPTAAADGSESLRTCRGRSAAPSNPPQPGTLPTTGVKTLCHSRGGQLRSAAGRAPSSPPEAAPARATRRAVGLAQAVSRAARATRSAVARS